MCGAAWKRVVEKTGETNRQKATRLGFSAKNPANQGINCAGGHGNGSSRQSTTTGWAPTCSCSTYPSDASYGGPNDVGELEGVPLDPIPCTVLDPFGGAGTTGLVADRLGRDAILIELNPEYAEMAAQRIRDDAGMFAEVEVV